MTSTNGTTCLDDWKTSQKRKKWSKWKRNREKWEEENFKIKSNGMKIESFVARRKIGIE